VSTCRTEWRLVHVAGWCYSVSYYGLSSSTPMTHRSQTSKVGTFANCINDYSNTYRKISYWWKGADRTMLSGVYDDGYSRRVNLYGLRFSQHALNLFSRWHQRLWFKRLGSFGGWGRCRGWKLQNCVPRGQFIFTCSHNFVVGRSYRIPTIRFIRRGDASQTDGRTDRQRDDTTMTIAIADHTA